MKVAIIGRTKNVINGKDKFSGLPRNGFFVTFGYSDDSVVGYETKKMFYGEEMMNENNGYIPSPGDECEVTVNFKGHIASLRPVVEKGK